MSAPETHPIEHITTIRRLLEHYEAGFAFVKELIQNAEDAFQKQSGDGFLHLQWYQPGADRGLENPLLQGPALVVVNNGPFEKKDRDGLMRMGLGSKSGDSERIGRFGLGMKSVFHVSEAFFFFESSGNPELRDLFCPWHPHQYKEWDITKDHQDWARMSEAVNALVPHFQQWFAVWIPLRRKESITNDNPIVDGPLAFPGDLHRCPENLLEALHHKKPGLGEALIFLNHLKSVSFHDGRKSFRFEHDRRNQLVTPDKRYYRMDIEQDETITEAWKTKTAWPKVFELTNAGERSVPDKAKWEGAVAITISQSAESKNGVIRIFWSVFLPVGNKPAEEVNVPGLGYDLNVFIHGYFFLTAC